MKKNIFQFIANDQFKMFVFCINHARKLFYNINLFNYPNHKLRIFLIKLGTEKYIV